MRGFELEAFRDYLALEAGHSTNTLESYLRDLRRLAEFAGSRGAREPGAVTPRLLREFVFALKDLGLSPATIRRQVSAVRTYFGFLVAEGRVGSDPSDRLETPRRGRTLPETLSVADLEALLAAPRVEEPLAWRDRTLLELGYGAGLRVSELCGLKLTDL
ncbi:MAG: site-specific integrase, partial [Gemmatimonadales bacterium]